MRFTSRALTVAVCAGALLGTGRDASGTGMIATLGADIRSGAATVRGRVVVNPCAPLVPVPVRSARVLPPAMGSMTGSIPDFPGGGSGSAALVAAADQTLAAGTYDFTSVTINAGVIVTCTGPVTIRTTGDVTITGAIRSTASGASIRFDCGGNLTFTGNQFSQPGVVTLGASAPITLDVNGRINSTVTTPALGRIGTTSGDVVLRCRDTTNGFWLQRVDVVSGDGAVDIRAAGSIVTSRMSVTAAGALDLRSYAGSIAIDVTQLSAGGALRAEAKYAMDFTGAVTADALGPLDLAAFGGRLNMTGATVETRTGGTGDLLVRADQLMNLTNSTLRHRGTGDLRIESPNADLTLRNTTVVQQGTGDVSLHEGSVLLVYGASVMSALHGDILLHGFAVEASGNSQFSAPEGTLEARPDRSLTLRADVFVPAPGPPTLDALKIDLVGVQSFSRVEVVSATAGTGGMSILLTTSVGYSGTAVLRGNFTSAGPLYVGTVSAPVLDLEGASFTTVRTGTFGASPPLTIETFRTGGGAIDLDGATVRTGDAPGATSGNVTVAARVAGGTDIDEPGGDPEPEPEPIQVVDGGIVVTSVRARRNARDAARTRIEVVGILDTGALPVDLAGELEVTVGTDVRTVDVAADRKGVLRFGNPALAARFKPSKIGASRVGFRLTWIGDPAEFLDATTSGQLDLRLKSAALDATASVRLVKGRYRLGRDPLSLLVPRVAPLSVSALLADGPADTLDMRLAFVTDGTPPEAPGDVALTFGPSLTATVPASAFATQKPGLFVATNPAPGIELVVVDWRRGTVRLVARDVEIGAFPGADPVGLDASLTLGTDTRFLRLRLGRRGAQLVY